MNRWEIDLKECIVPDGTKGDWTVASFTISEEESMMSIMQHRERRCLPGEYKLLRRGDVVVMSNTTAEINDMRHVLNRATGHVLINGLGLGLLPNALLKIDEVERITIIEISQDLIDLVGSCFDDPRLEIINYDAYEYKPPKGVRYGYVWHDIWDTLCSDNLKLMEKLHRKYGRRCDQQDSWGRTFLKREQRRERYNGWY
jgi:hypothetical protein